MKKFFNDDYLYFTTPLFPPEVTEREVEIIWRLLGLEPGKAVLDLGCGYGRISNRLAQRGCKVTGLDSNALFLELARQDARSMGVDVNYIQGDIRNLPWSQQFDYAIMWFNTFGYFSDEDNHQVLVKTQRALRPGGRLLIDNINRDGFVRMSPQDAVQERDGNLIIFRQKYDTLSGRLVGERIAIREGVVNREYYTIRLFTFPELRDWLKAAGFAQVEGLGLEGEPFALHSAQMEVIAQK